VKAEIGDGESMSQTINDTDLRVAEIIEETRSEGPGRRLAIWVQGCSIRCPGCCNPHMLDPQKGSKLTMSDALALLRRAHRRAVEGITLIGGEPFDQAANLAPLAEAATDLDLGVMIFSGYTLSTLRASSSNAIHRLLAATDLLIDGPYQHARQSAHRRWIGSDNQQIHLLNDRYRDHPELYQKSSQSIEITMRNGDLMVNGWPSIADNLISHIPRYAELHNSKKAGESSSKEV
jgi:anaerobic ribonucleoside-triphosphate reductase activating protein